MLHHHLIDQPLEIGVFVAVARHGQSGVVALEKLAQLGARPQAAGGDDQEPVAFRMAERGFNHRGDTVGRALDHDQPAATKHRDCRELVGQPGGVRSEIAGCESRYLKGVLRIVGELGDELAGAVTHQAVIGSVDEDGAEACLECFEVFADLVGAGLDHMRGLIGYSGSRARK